MSLPALLPAPAELALDSVSIEAGRITIHATTQRTAVPCPDCGTVTTRVHSHYRRMLRDLPWLGIPVRIQLRTRRFFCPMEACPRRIFTERLPETAASYARCTLRLWGALRAVALALGGEGGRRLTHGLAMGASGDTLLRRLRHVGQPSHPISAPRVVGVDEWAWKKGQRYGTILVDLEQGRVMDLLPARSADSFADWLQRRPSVEVISRDRSNLYAEGAARGAPNAVQVADRWHLLRNLTEAVERALEGRTALLRQAAMPKTAPPPAEGATPDATPAAPLTRAQQAKACPASGALPRSA